MKKILPISVVIPCYNCVETIERALISIYEQSALPSEVILVNDKSTDNTLELLNTLEVKYGNINIRVISLEENSGPGTARNVGWNESNYEYVAFLDSDDAWDKSKLEQQYQIMTQDKTIYLSCHNSVVKDSSFLADEKLLVPSVEELTITKMFISNRVSTRSVMVFNDRSFQFLDGKKYSEDFLLWMEMLFNKKRLVYIDSTLAFSFKRPFGEHGLTGDLCKMQKGQLEVYDILNSKNYISKPLMYIIKIYSYIRFVRRFLVSKLL